MAIKTNMQSMQPRRQAYKREIQLMSRGFAAPKAFPDGKITVYPWDSDVDAFLQEASKTTGGNLLYGVVEQVCNMNGAHIDQFVYGEINAILLLSRAIQFDGVVDYESHCPFCNAVAKESIKVPEELAPIGVKPADYPGYDEITLPTCKDVVRIRPLLVKDHKKIEEKANDTLWNKLSERQLQILLPIVTVNGGAPDNLDEVASWYGALSPKDARFLETQEDLLSPHLESRIPHKCGKCQKTFHHNLTFDQAFF